MEANEFRINNYVYDKDGLFLKISTISEVAIFSVGKYAFVGMPIDWAKPIELTEEWAIKFGYECLVEMACDFSDCGFNIEVTSEDLKRLKVHQAQNLYFALTQEELIFKN